MIIRIVASGCRALFADEPEIVILEAADAESGERVLTAEHPDICVLDINLPTVSGFELARRILGRDAIRAHHHVQHERRSGLRRARDRNRRQGLCLQDRRPDDLVEAIREVGKGGTYLPPAIARSIAFAGPRSPRARFPS